MVMAEGLPAAGGGGGLDKGLVVVDLLLVAGTLWAVAVREAPGWRWQARRLCEWCAAASRWWTASVDEQVQ